MLNKTIIQGRLTKDAELRHTQTGKAVASFTLAWSEQYQDQERKLFLPCVAWSGTGEFISKWFKKDSWMPTKAELEEYEKSVDN